MTRAPKPRDKANRVKKLEFDVFDWLRYISEEKLLEAIPTVYGCDPRDVECFKAILADTKAAKMTD